MKLGDGIVYSGSPKTLMAARQADAQLRGLFRLILSIKRTHRHRDIPGRVTVNLYSKLVSTGGLMNHFWAQPWPQQWDRDVAKIPAPP